MGLSADAAMVLLREAMEGLLHHELVSATIFEALGEYGGELPVDGRELQAFVGGPLRRALERRVDAATASSLQEHLQPILTAIVDSEPPAPPEPPSSSTESRPSPLLDDKETLPMPDGCEPYVLVIAEHDALERRLRLALGGALETSTATGVVGMHAKILGHAPRLVIVDATAPPPFTVPEVARALMRNQPGAFTALWGCHEPYAEALAARLEASFVMGLAIDEGVAPLLDLVRTFGLGTTQDALDGTRRPTPNVHAAAALDGLDGSQRPTPKVGALAAARRTPHDG